MMTHKVSDFCSESLRLKLFADMVRTGCFTEKQFEACGCIGQALELEQEQECCGISMSSKLGCKSRIELTLARWPNLLVSRRHVVEATRRVILIMGLPYQAL